MSEGEKFDCNTCAPRDKTIRGCDGNKRWKVGKHEVYGCPQKLITFEALEGIKLWGKWKRFGFPEVGGWAQQVARAFDVIEAIEGEYIELENAKVEKVRGNR